MRKIAAILLVFSLIFCLCACGHKEKEDAQRKCGVYVTLEADDVYSISCGTENGSESATPAEGGALTAGNTYHFDFAGASAEGNKSAVIPYMICIYDKDFNVISEASFEDDFSNMARVDIVVTKEHNIIYKGGSVNCGGKLLVTLTNTEASLGVNVTEASISVSNNAEASEKISTALSGLIDSFTAETEANRAKYTENTSGLSGEIPAFNMTHDLSVARGDNNIASFRVRDYVYLGTQENEIISGHSYDLGTGNELKLSDVFNDVDAVKNVCSEYILISTTEDDSLYNEGFTSVIPELIKDGSWYFDSEGLVIVADKGSISDKAHEFKVPYSDIEQYLNDAYIPDVMDEMTPCGISAGFADENTAAETVFVGDQENPCAAGDVVISSEGDIFNVAVYSVSYNTEYNSYGLIRQLFYCSDLRYGGAFAIKTALESTPNILVQYTTPYGSIVNNLLSVDENGNISVIDPDGGNKGIDIISQLPVALDLNGDGADDEISISGGKVSVKSGENSADFNTEFKEIRSAILHDSDCDGNFELFIGGDKESESGLLCCLKFDGKSLNAIPFNGENYLRGSIGSFNANIVSVSSRVDILGTYSCVKDFEYANGSFKSVSQEEYRINTDKYITPSADIQLADGGSICAGTELRLTGTDLNSFVSVETKDGKIGRIGISKTDGDGGWLINGTAEAQIFSALPYEN